MAAKHSNTYQFNVHIEQICSIFRDGRFAATLGFTFKQATPIQNGMIFRFGNSVSLTSWGENIDITVFYMTDTSTQVTIQSECALPTQVIDWGKNKENVDRVYNQIASVLAYNQSFMQQQQIASPKFCSRCGASLEAGAKFCTSCGMQVG